MGEEESGMRSKKLPLPHCGVYTAVVIAVAENSGSVAGPEETAPAYRLRPLALQRRRQLDDFDLHGPAPNLLVDSARAPRPPRPSPTYHGAVSQGSLFLSTDCFTRGSRPSAAGDASSAESDSAGLRNCFSSLSLEILPFRLRS